MAVGGRGGSSPHGNQKGEREGAEQHMALRTHPLDVSLTKHYLLKFLLFTQIVPPVGDQKHSTHEPVVEHFLFKP
jgi:hypothetical protein